MKQYKWLLLILFLLGACQKQEPAPLIYPLPQPTETPILRNYTGQVVEVSFPELQADPAYYQNQLIRVTGNPVTLSPALCQPHKGPRFQLALIDETLQMNLLGYETVLSLVKPDTPLTLEGVWQRYAGPLGCGKVPADSTAWYLQVQYVVAPNPLSPYLVSGVPTVRAKEEAGILPAATTTPLIIVAPLPTHTPIAVDAGINATSPITAAPIATATTGNEASTITPRSVTNTPTMMPANATPTLFNFPATATMTPSPTPQTPSPTPTHTPTATPTSTPEITNTPVATLTPPPPPPTNTPPAYPDATSTPDNYP